MSEEHHVETERGFGTGLRAQLAKRQEESSEAAEVQPVPAQGYKNVTRVAHSRRD